MDDIFRLGIISDSHLLDLSAAIDLASSLIGGPFAEVDCILHAGDMVIADFESCFNDIPCYSVQGNMDAPRLDLPLTRIIEIAGHRIGLIHGWGPPHAVAKNVLSEFDNENIDLLIFGHSHTPYKAFHGRTLLFNPGSATDHRGHAESCSVGLIEIGQVITARHIPFEQSS